MSENFIYNISNKHLKFLSIQWEIIVDFKRDAISVSAKCIDKIWTKFVRFYSIIGNFNLFLETVPIATSIISRNILEGREITR